MAEDDRMSVDERRKYLKRMHGRYWAADRRGRGRLLDEMVEYTGLNRKYLIHLLRQDSLERKPRKRQRGPKYGADVRHVVRIVWESLDYICAERVTPSLLATAQHLETFGEVELNAELEEKLGVISTSTVQRMIRGFGRSHWHLPRRGPEQANHLRKNVPMERLPWSLTEPGHFELDLVHHCGPRAFGDYVHTMQMIDIATAWSERVALLGRSQHAVARAFRYAEERLPFPILRLHPDNGSEFFNNHLVRIWGEEMTGLQLSRSRPYQKNDNRFVEQKNATLVRAYLGTYRLDTPAETERLNRLYDKMWVYYNLFQLVFRLTAKRVVDGRVRRHFDTPKTPYERLRASGVLMPEARRELDQLHRATNPLALHHALYDDLEQLWDDPDAKPC